MAELEHVAEGSVEHLRYAHETVGRKLKNCGKLEEDAAKFFTQAFRSELIEIAEHPLRFPEFLEMRNVTRCLHGKRKTVRTPLLPALEHIQPRKAVIGDVQLKCVEMVAVKLEPPPLRKVIRIKDPLPLRIVIPRTSDPPLHNLFQSATFVPGVITAGTANRFPSKNYEFFRNKGC